MKAYCKRCGTMVNWDAYKHGDVLDCPCCKAKLSMSETIPDFTMESRVSQLKNMHALMMSANNENIYMSWIYTVPDCPSDEDFFDIALNDEEYNEVFDKFIDLIKYKGMRY